MTSEQARAQMVGQQIRAWEVLDGRVLDVFSRVPREHFVPSAYAMMAGHCNECLEDRPVAEPVRAFAEPVSVANAG